MDLSTFTRRVVATAAASALTAGALVVAASSPAQAAGATTTYSCTTSFGTFSVPVQMDVPALDLVTQINAGQPVPEGLMNFGGTHAVDLVFTLPAALATTLTGLGGVSAVDSPDFALDFGSEKVPVTQLALGSLTPGPAGALLVSATGTNGDFATPGAGLQQITMPTSFTMLPTVGSLGPVPVPCTAEQPGTVSEVDVLKNDSTTAVKAPAKVARGKVAKIVATVAGGFNTATGKVVFKDGRKTLATKSLNKKGKAVLKTAGLKVGKHRITARYIGDDYRNASVGRKTVKVVR